MPHESEFTIEAALEEAKRFDATFQEGINQLLAMQNSQGFKILLAYLKADADEATAELVEADALDSKEILRLQNRVKRYLWFAEAPSQIIRAQVAKEISDESESQVYDDS